MSKVTRYYVRELIETGEIVVEKSEILDREDYINNVAHRADSQPFEMVQELSDNYAQAVKEFFAIETDTLTETTVLLEWEEK